LGKRAWACRCGRKSAWRKQPCRVYLFLNSKDDGSMILATAQRFCRTRSCCRRSFKLDVLAIMNYLRFDAAVVATIMIRLTSAG
jgi:hypothetical protein